MENRAFELNRESFGYLDEEQSSATAEERSRMMADVTKPQVLRIDSENDALALYRIEVLYKRPRTRLQCFKIQ